MEPPLGAPFVAELLEQHPNKPRDVIGRMNRWLRIKRLDVLDNRRGILDAFLLRRDDERHERKLCEFLILAVGVQTARNPSMRNSLVAEVRTDLHRIPRKLNPMNVIFASHRMVSFQNRKAAGNEDSNSFLHHSERIDMGPFAGRDLTRRTMERDDSDLVG